ALPFDDGEPAVDAAQCKRLGRAVWPLDLQIVDGRRRAQSEVKSPVVLRRESSTADDVLAKPQLSDGQIGDGAYAVPRPLPARVSDQGERYPVTCWPRDVAKQGWRRVDVVDHRIEQAVAIQIADRQAPRRQRPRESTVRSRANPLECAGPVPK